jgi:hypothetical protein
MSLRLPAFPLCEVGSLPAAASVSLDLDLFASPSEKSGEQQCPKVDSVLAARDHSVAIPSVGSLRSHAIVRHEPSDRPAKHGSQKSDRRKSHCSLSPSLSVFSLLVPPSPYIPTIFRLPPWIVAPRSDFHAPLEFLHSPRICTLRSDFPALFQFSRSAVIFPFRRVFGIPP